MAIDTLEDLFHKPYISMLYTTDTNSLIAIVNWTRGGYLNQKVRLWIHLRLAPVNQPSSSQ